MNDTHNRPQTAHISNFGEAAFLHFHGLNPHLIKYGRRFIFEFTIDAEFLRISALYDANDKVGIRDFENIQKKLKALMYTFEGGQRG